MIVNKIDFDRPNRLNSPKSTKWLELLYLRYNVSDSFLKLLNSNLKFQFEHAVNKKIPWQIMFYYFERTDDGMILEFIDQNRFYYKQYISILDKTTDDYYYGWLYWYDPINYSKIDFSIETLPPLNFFWVTDHSSINEEAYKRLNSYENPFKLFSIFHSLSFQTLTHLTCLPHEGKFAITLFDIDDVDKVSVTLERARTKWNTQTDQARETGDSSLERGYCHTITFDGVEDNIGYWYIDAGSAHEGIHEFLLKELSDSGIKIKSVEIQMI